MWDDVENGIILNIQGENIFGEKNQKGLSCFDFQYYKVVDIELVVDVVMILAEALNFLRVKQFVKNPMSINPNGFGIGTVCEGKSQGSCSGSCTVSGGHSGKCGWTSAWGRCTCAAGYVG